MSVANTMRDVLAGVGEHLADRISAIPAEVGQAAERMGRLGTYEIGSAIFNGHGYRGDLGLLTNAQPQTMREMLEQDAQQYGQEQGHAHTQEQDQGQAQEQQRGLGR